MLTRMFHENMSYVEAQKVLFSSLKQGMNQDEIRRIRSDFAEIIPIITSRELGQEESTFTSYQI
ncbi:MAG: hypothetical protein IJ617_07425 [Oscillospiraceae bacterium]|nr:hypothetical protein [Oscillospiraceae bacterium]